MASDREMKRIIQHASAMLGKAFPSTGNVQVTAAMAYAKGVLDLLASYLVATENPRQAQRAHSWESYRDVTVIHRPGTDEVWDRDSGDIRRWVKRGDTELDFFGNLLLDGPLAEGEPPP